MRQPAPLWLWDPPLPPAPRQLSAPPLPPAAPLQLPSAPPLSQALLTKYRTHEPPHGIACKPRQQAGLTPH